MATTRAPSRLRTRSLTAAAALALALAALAAAPRAAHAVIIWRGDVETGDLSQFSGGPNMARVRVAMTPVREGRYAARIELRNEDRWPNGLRRVELGYTPTRATFEGSDRYYAFSVIDSSDLPMVRTVTNSIAYWESYPNYRQVMAFNVQNGRVTFVHRLPRPGSTTAAGNLWTGEFASGRWHDFVLHVRWSADAAMGFVELWYDGVRVLDRTPVQTMVRDAAMTYPNFFHCGLLHGDFDTMPQAVYIDRVLDGTTLADVLLATPPGDGGVTSDAGPRDGGGEMDGAVPPQDASAQDTGGGGEVDASAQDAPVGAGDAAARVDTGAGGRDAGGDAGGGGMRAGCGCRVAAATPRTPARREGLATLAALAAAAGLVAARRKRRARR